jgi:hypothetical protein
MRDQLMKGLDIYKPDWYIRLANETELQEFALTMKSAFLGHPMYASPARDYERALTKLRDSVAARLEFVVSAAVEVGLVKMEKNNV